MTDPSAALVSRAISPSQVTIEGLYTNPRSYGVYQLPDGSSTTRFRYGNHPVRQRELKREFGSCVLRFLFESQGDAAAMAEILTAREPDTSLKQGSPPCMAQVSRGERYSDNSIYNRESQLRERLNVFLEKEFELPESDYYARLDLAGILKIKSILSDVNNLFTLKVSMAFAEWVANHLAMDYSEKEQIIAKIQETKPNSNGYDIEVSGPVKLIAEVKCNVPINSGRVYGSAQRNGIAKDIRALIHGKSKSTVSPADYLKFMVFLDTPEIRDATIHFVKNMREDKERITYLDEGSVAEDPSKVYIAYVGC